MSSTTMGEEEREAFLAEPRIGGSAGVAKDILVRLHPERWLRLISAS